MQGTTQTLLAPVFSAMVAAACGPDAPAQPEESTWMLGTWSDRIVGYPTNECSTSHLHFLADGTLREGSASCYSGPTYPKAYTWEREDEHTVIVNLTEGHYADAWRITLAIHPATKTRDCDVIEVVDFINGELEEGTRREYVRGAVCMKLLGPCPEGQGSCEAARTEWCEGPPPPCDDQAL